MTFNKKITIIATAEMGPGTFEAKFAPIAMNRRVGKIFVLRKSRGPSIEKVNYIILPSISKIKFFGFFVRPIYLLYFTIKYGADVILAYHIIPHAFFAYFAALLTGKQLIIAQTGLFIQGKAKNTILIFFLKLIIKKANYLFVPGSKSYQFWSEKGVSTQKLKILHSTIDTDHFIPNKNILKEYDFIVLSRMVEEKRIDIIVELLFNLKKDGFRFRAVFVGDGNKYNKLTALVSEYNLNTEIDFVGFQLNTNDWFNKARFYLMYSNSEGLPTSLMQAMACGLIPVSTNVGNIADLISNENGFMFSFGEKEMYLSTLKKLLSDFDDHAYSKYSINCRRAVEMNHSYKSVTKKWDTIFQEIDL